MNTAKEAVKDFMSRSGHHDTTVHEKVNPAVTHETHKLQQHENVTTAIDKEVHQDHYHTSVQPVKDREVLPEQHHHNLGAVEHRHVEHDDSSRVKERLAREAAQFRDERVEGEARHTQTVNPTLAGEHIHHHVHETIQPVVDKETIEPHVVHTTVPIHEVHHNAAQHHSASALPAVSMADFKKQGGVLTGREERYDGFEGEPRTVGGSHTGTGLSTGTSDRGLTGSSHSGSGLTGSHHTGTGLTGAGSGLTGSHGTHGTHGSSGLTGSSTAGGLAGREGLTGREGEGLSGNRDGHLSRDTAAGSDIDSKTGKPSLMDKLNPMKDSDHDGKKGMMD